MSSYKAFIGGAIAASSLAMGPALATEELRISAGTDLTATLGTPVLLAGSVSKDASIGWSKVEGPGDIVFERPHSAQTSASFSQPGDYTLMLGGYDGFVAYDMVRVTVSP